MSILRKSAKGQSCKVMLPGICNHINDTTALAHLNGGGMGMKFDDLFGAHCCSSCHDVLDRRVQTDLPRDFILLQHLQGMVRTQQWWLDNGYIEIRGET